MSKTNRKIYIVIIIYIYTAISAYAQNNNEWNSIYKDTLLSKEKKDSLKIQELKMQVQELKLSQIALLNEKKNIGKTDSLKKVFQKKQIDSLRAITKGYPIIIDKDTLFYLYARRGGVMPADRASKVKEMILAEGKKLRLKPDSIYMYETEYVTDIMSGDKVIITLSDQDGLWQNSTRQELAKKYTSIISKKISELHSKYGLQQKIKSFLILFLVIITQTIAIYFTHKLFKKIKNRLKKIINEKFEANKFLTNERQEVLLVSIIKIFKYSFIIIQLIISIFIIFSIFPETERYVYHIFTFMGNLAKDMGNTIIHYIPNLVKIIFIYLIFKYLIKILKYFSGEISEERIKIKGFYSDWAHSTFNILRFLLYSFMFIMIWPLLPNSNSPAFQGISVFIGLIISLGSTTVIGNLMSGLVITYMRAFKIGDQIKLNETTGNVIEKTPFVTRIRTSKNELITIPNSFILSSQTVNYSASARKYGIIIYSDITVGYDIPRKQVEDLLIEAATNTEGVLKNPTPFVLVKELEDFYCCYQINAYTDRDLTMPKVYSCLHKNIMDKFHEEGIEILSPHFYAEREGNEIVMPPQYKNKPNV
ncbi:Mechanosensitive ion channel [Apibacter mensalis]|uniref:Mechanosensitive ion channel n=1 Tax=Apibacter mensalis TaxID=1586267 RepID=A0A0X3AR81_9FLAO|nr:mechanosensitive ion channel family protein [Apibacter mensalis]CVK16920.1 Mechanosensitive ion channel [Apibacter mensalis]